MDIEQLQAWLTIAKEKYGNVQVNGVWEGTGTTICGIYYSRNHGLDLDVENGNNHSELYDDVLMKPGQEFYKEVNDENI